MQLISLLLIGFSIVSAILLVVGNLVQQTGPQQFSSKLAGFILIASLAVIQWLNLQFLISPSAQIFSPVYIGLLYCIAPSFYFFSRQLLTAGIRFSYWHAFHISPVFMSFFIPEQWALPLAFFVGSGYLLWLARVIYFLRNQRQRFKLEILALAGFFCIAVGVILLGFIWPLVTGTTFIISYSILIGLAFFATVLTLLSFPSITDDVVEAVQAAYVESTLKNIDRKTIIGQLNQLMQQEKIYTLESLSLAMLAEQLQLNSHQLSELINVEFQQGFSKYIRKYRIEAAKALLIEAKFDF